jgi:hypothetical protein
VTGGAPSLQPVCALALDLLVPVLQKDFDAKLSPDVTCKTSINLCGVDYPKCKLFSQWPPAQTSPLVASEGLKAAAARNTMNLPLMTMTDNERAAKLEEILSSLRALPAAENGLSGALMQFIGNTNTPTHTRTHVSCFSEFGVAEVLSPAAHAMSAAPAAVVDHLPLFDADKDRFSPVKELRGSHWRGKDCDDTNGAIYPGRKTTTLPPLRGQSFPFTPHTCP